MKAHLDQAHHNKSFHDCIEATYTEKFFDWKITVLFYIAIHYLKALAIKRGFDIGEAHFEIELNVNPDKQSPIMPIKRGAWQQYKRLSDYSRTARYEGITDFKTFEKIKQIDHSNCLTHLDNFKKYIESQGIVVDVTCPS